MTDEEIARRASRAEFITRLFVVALVLIVVSAGALLWQIRQTQIEGTPLGQKLLASSDRILDCTEPTAGRDSCYQRSQRQTAEAVSQISGANIAAVVCALGVPNGTPLDDALEQVTQCVAEKLAKGKP